MSRVLILLLTAFISILLYSVQAQSVNNVLLKGLLIDENSKEPIGAEVKFEDSEGDVIKVNADPLSGIFEQLLKADEKYTITFSGPDILRKEIVFTTKEANTYSEQKETFKVLKLVPGAKIVSMKISDNGKAVSESGLKSLNEIKTLLRFNRSLYIDMITKTRDLHNSLETLTEDKSWRMYRTKIELSDAAAYKSHKVDFPDNTDLVIIINKVEDPFK